MADETIDELAQRIAGFNYASAEQQLIDIYRFAQLQVLEALERAIKTRAESVPLQLQRLLNTITKQYQGALLRSRQWVQLRTPEAFAAGMKIAETRLQQEGTRLLRTSFTQVNRGAVEATARETMNDLLRATTLTEESVKSRVRRVMLEETRMMAATGMRPKEQAKVIAERMAEDGVFGITARNGRHIPMDEYARIVGHTKLRQAHTEGTINLITENGLDLVQITTHLHKPDACSPLEGKVYSLTGHTPGWPVLPRKTPFHIGCKHVTTPFIPTFRDPKEVERIREESNRPEQITVYPQEKLDELEAKRLKRDRFMRQKLKLRREDEAAVLAGDKPAPADMKAYERSLTARANARVRAMDERPLRGARTLSSALGGHAAGIEVSPEAVDSIWNNAQPFIKSGILPKSMERSDVELVTKYLKKSLAVPTFETLAKGGVLGNSILLHELTELKWYADRGKNPFDPDEQKKFYRKAHTAGLKAEHDWLFTVARQRGYNLKQKGSLVRYNPNALSEPQQLQDLSWLQSQKAGLRFDKRDRATAGRFFTELKREQHAVPGT